MVAAYDPGRHIVLGYGGATGLSGETGAFVYDTWVWDGANWSQVAPGGPQLIAPAISYDPATKTVIMVGTTPTYEPACETWSWTGSAWQQLHPASAPSNRSGASLAPDPGGTGLVMFGGSRPLPLNDTWTWDGLSWTQRHVPGPAARHSAAFALDESRHRVVLTGGVTDTAIYSDTWLWDGMQWTPQPSVSLPTAGFAYAVDTGQQVLLVEVDGSVLVWGGSDWSTA
jgi:hypothetical protein